MRARFVAGLGFGLILPVLLVAQATAQNERPDQMAVPQAAASQLATVHGIVRNAATGEPLPRALVRIDGDASSGALTDGDGRFEIPDVPVGPQEFEVIKPGFLDTDSSAAGADSEVRQFILTMAAGAHNIQVAAEMPDVEFAMDPANAIHGQIQLSTGDPAEGLGVVLLRREPQSGRMTWQVQSTAKANSEDMYRFGGLADGVYVLYSEPAMESEAATNLVKAAGVGNVARSGFASQFYPEARDLAGATKIQVAGGEQAEANLALTLEPFHIVSATVTFPGGRQSPDGPMTRSGMGYQMQVLDAQGHQLPYTAQYDESTRSVQTLLPDGNYTLEVAAVGPTPWGRLGISSSSSVAESGGTLAGSVDFSVSGHAVPNLRIPLSAVRANSVQLNLIRSGTSTAQLTASQERAQGVFITLSQTGGWISDGMISSYAEGSLSGPLNSAYTQPGSYWAHTSIADKRFCEGSLTAGGANLAREPLALGLTGPAAPLSLTLRDDCASLTLTLPGTLAVPIAGEERFYTVYAVPDFDSTVDVVPVTLRPSTGGTITLTGLTPGNYHIYAFDKPIELAYRNAAVLAALANPGQAVTLSPGSQTNLVVEVSEH